MDDGNGHAPDDPITDPSPISSPNAQASGKLDNNQANTSPTLPSNNQAPKTSNKSNKPVDPPFSANDPNRWTYITKSGQRRRFSPKQIDVITKLISGMPGNRAVMSTKGYTQNPRSAIVTASKLLATANQHGIIAREMELAGIGRSVQMGALSDIIHARHQTADTQEYVDEDGKTYRRVITTRRPTARDIVSAISTADRISGAKEARRVQADAVSSELKALFKRYSPAQALKDVSSTPVDSPLSPIGGPTSDTSIEGIDDPDLGVLGLTVEPMASDPDRVVSESDRTTSDTNEHERAWSTWAGVGEGGNGSGS